MSEPLLEKLAQLESGVRRAIELIAHLREENRRLSDETTRLMDERRQVVSHVDGILKELANLEAKS
jgi:FtsZ-binding cell division protein ZapB